MTFAQRIQEWLKKCEPGAVNVNGIISEKDLRDAVSLLRSYPKTPNWPPARLIVTPEKLGGGLTAASRPVMICESEL